MPYPKTRTIRGERRAAALARQDERNKRSIKEQIEIVRSRRGESKKELRRLMDQAETD